MLLKDKVAIITGGAKGIGRAIALRFAKEGCDCVINAMHIEGAEKVAKEVKALGRKAIAIAADVSSTAQVNDMVARTIKEFKKIDILVNNAGGVAGDAKIEETSDEAWNRVIATNLTGQFLMCRAVIPYMRKNKYGKIIFISSMGAVSPCVSVLHYHTAKAGILGLTTNLAFELAPQNIYVNAIVPGPVDTTFWDALVPAGPAREALFSAIAKKEIPLEKIGRPEDIAGPALFLASGLSNYVTGQIIYAAGGQPLLAHGATFDIEAYLMGRAKI